jgi:hypothetical protein
VSLVGAPCVILLSLALFLDKLSRIKIVEHPSSNCVSATERLRAFVVKQGALISPFNWFTTFIAKVMVKLGA